MRSDLLNNQEPLPVVAIIDSDRARRQTMAGSFRGSAAVEVAFSDEENLRLRRETAAGESLPHFSPALVALRHFGDLSLEPDLAAVLTVYYGGNGGDDPRCPADAEERIWRVVSPGGAGILDVLEARQLLAYARARQSGTPRPAFLEPPSMAFETLAALALLCQGYLAVLALAPEPVRRSDAVLAALQRMGLQASLGGDGPGNLIPGSEAGPDIVCSPGWWLDVFELAEGDEANQARLWRDFEERVGGAWRRGEAPVTVRGLLNAIRTAPVGPADLIANAYLSLSDRLEGR